MSEPTHSPRRNRLRQALRWWVFATAVVLAWPSRPESSTSVFLPALSPFVAVASVVSTRAVGVLAVLALPVLVLALVYRRWFCRYGCPVGLLQETVQRLRPGGRKRWLKVPPIGQWLVLLTLGGAMLGYPLFLWLDPLAIFHGFLNAWRAPLAVATLLTGLGLPMLLLLALVAPRLWCQRICPLGGAQDLLAGPRRFLQRRARGKALDKATSLSSPPTNLASESVGTRSTRVPIFDRTDGDAGGTRSYQRQREIHEDGGGRSDEGEKRLTPTRGRGVWGGAIGRRWFLAVLSGALGAFALREARGQNPPPLRPPGALDELRFTGVCVRCGNCAQVCPSKIIQPDFGASGVVGFLSPRLRFETDYCREDCHCCNEVCPSGAIARLSLAEKKRHVIGQAVVDLDLCLLAQGRECTACIQKCPYQAIAMHSADGGFANEPRVVLDRCNGCGACEAACPTQPVRAMRVQALPAA